MTVSSNPVSATIFDSDADRSENDQTSISNLLYGYLRVTDDDPHDPTLSNVVVKGQTIPTAARTAIGPTTCAA